jgi:hypothetical protein
MIRKFKKKEVLKMTGKYHALIIRPGGIKFVHVPDAGELT